MKSVMKIELANTQHRTCELTAAWRTAAAEPFNWVEALVDCPAAQGLYTYRVPPELEIQPGCILSVPFGSQQVGAIALRLMSSLPEHLDPQQMRAVEEIVSPGFCTPGYWQLLLQVAQHYQTSLIQVVRAALPPGLLAKSQQRIRLVENGVSVDTLALLSPAAQQIIKLLQASKSGDYTRIYLQRQVRGLRQGLRQLQQLGWVESYLEPPTVVRPKYQQAVTVTMPPDEAAEQLTARQQEVLRVLWRHGGDLWLTEALQLCHTSAATLKTLERKGCVAIQERERLRTEQEGEVRRDQPKQLTAAQAQALQYLQGLEDFATVLLHGVTGSGKTEVYLQAIAPRLAAGQSVLVLVPEIGLTPQLTDRFRARFGSKVLVYHSALSDGERYDTWRHLLRGEPQIVIGTRSAVFTPLQNLGLIILDEEHDASFKQDQPAPCYHARTVAQWRSQLEDCPLLLGSATPSLESWRVCQPLQDERQGRAGTEQSGDAVQASGSETDQAASEMTGEVAGSDQSFTPESALQSIPTDEDGMAAGTLAGGDGEVQSDGSGLGTRLTLPQRIHARPMPTIQVVDLRQEFQEGNRSIFSRPLQIALQEMKQRQQQGLLFIHRRGHSTFVSCRACGYVVQCPHCDVSLSYHRPYEHSTPLLRCHYCNYVRSHPADCPECGSQYLKNFGSGTQRVVQAIAKQFPDMRCIRFDSDTTRNKGAHRALLTRFAQGEADLLVGTQMLTKGIDLPQVTLVGILAADGLLYMSDYRASERTFQTLLQVAGRAGRGDERGRVILQTYNPNHPVIQAVQQQQYDRFAVEELQQRQATHFPPYCQLVLLRLSSPDLEAVQQTAMLLADVLAAPDSMLAGAEYQLLGPAPAPILRVARRYRWHLLLKFPLGQMLPDLTELRSHCPRHVSLTIDVDPLNFG